MGWEDHQSREDAWGCRLATCSNLEAAGWQPTTINGLGWSCLRLQVSSSGISRRLVTLGPVTLAFGKFEPGWGRRRGAGWKRRRGGRSGFRGFKCGGPSRASECPSRVWSCPSLENFLQNLDELSQHCLQNKFSLTHTLTREGQRNHSYSSENNGKYSTNGCKNASKRLQIGLTIFSRVWLLSLSKVLCCLFEEEEVRSLYGFWTQRRHMLDVDWFAGSFRVRKSYPNFLDLLLQAPGTWVHTWQHSGRRRKRPRRGARRERMKRQKPDMRRETLESINKKKTDCQGSLKLNMASNPRKRRQPCSRSRRKQDQGQEYFEDEGSFYLINAHGGASALQGGLLQVVCMPPHLQAPHPASAAPPRPTSRATRTAPSRTAPPA